MCKAACTITCLYVQLFAYCSTLHIPRNSPLTPLFKSCPRRSSSQSSFTFLKSEGCPVCSALRYLALGLPRLENLSLVQAVAGAVVELRISHFRFSSSFTCALCVWQAAAAAVSSRLKCNSSRAGCVCARITKLWQDIGLLKKYSRDCEHRVAGNVSKITEFVNYDLFAVDPRSCCYWTDLLSWT